MRPFAEQIESLVRQGYGQAAAQAKVAHDAVLRAMDVCGFKQSSTVKGGVVMSHVTNDIRTAFSLTQAQGDELKRSASALVGSAGGSARISVASSTPGFDPVTVSRRALETVVNARIQELFAVILDDLDSANLAHRFNAGIVLSGGVAATPGVTSLAEHVFGRRARIGEFVSDIVALEDGPAPASYATAAGLLLMALRDQYPQTAGNPFKRIFGGLFG